MSNQWFYAKNGQQFGPISSSQLKAFARSGQLQAADLVWKEGMTDWLPASRVQGLIDAPSPQAPAATPPLLTGSSVVSVSNPGASHGVHSTSQAPIIDTSQAAAQQFGDRAKSVAKEAGADAWQALKVLALNPVGGLRTAFDNLGPARAMTVGIVFAVIFDLCVLVGVRLLLSGFFAALSGMPPGMRRPMPDPEMGDFIKLLLLGLVPLASATGGCAVVRTLFRGRGSIHSDIFIAGASLLPMGIALLLMGILGFSNIEVFAVLAVFAVTTTILMLYSGCTKLQEIPESAAVLSVPVMILANLYLCKIILASLFTRL